MDVDFINDMQAWSRLMTWNSQSLPFSDYSSINEGGLLRGGGVSALISSEKVFISWEELLIIVFCSWIQL